MDCTKTCCGGVFIVGALMAGAGALCVVSSTLGLTGVLDLRKVSLINLCAGAPRGAIGTIVTAALGLQGKATMPLVAGFGIAEGALTMMVGGVIALIGGGGTACCNDNEMVKAFKDAS